MEGDRLFLSRLSSIKTDYEEDRRKTLQNFNSQFPSNLVFCQPKPQICKKLAETLLDHNMDELYIEILCLLFPTAESQESPASKPLLRFLQVLFNFQPDRHSSLMDKAKAKEMRGRVLQLEVVEGRGLLAKDLNGLSDPFCTLYVTRKDRSQRTRVLNETLEPHWNECFKFAVQEPEKDFLQIYVWDHDPEERLRDKLKRLGQVKSSRSMGNFVREVTHGRSSNQEFMGKLQIPIKEVSTETIEKWYPLKDGSGELYLRMTLGVEKNRRISSKQYMVSLQILMIHEMTKDNPMIPFHWELKFEPWADYLLRQLGNGWGLKAKDVLLAKSQALLKLHPIFPINGITLYEVLYSLVSKTPRSEFNSEEIGFMKRTAEEFLNFSINFIKDIHNFFQNIPITIQLYHILKTVELLIAESHVRSILCCDSVRKQMQSAISHAAFTTFNGILAGLGDLKANLEAKEMLKLGQLLNEDLRNGKEMIHNNFESILGIDYHLITYAVYDAEYGKLVKVHIEKSCSLLKKMRESEDKEETQPEFAINLFHLYLSLKQFSSFSKGDSHWIIGGSFHEWFFGGVTDLLSIFGEMWMRWMGKSVEMEDEDLIFYKTKYKITSSAFDSAQIIMSAIQGFWVSLSWPVPDQALFIVDKILKELCGYSICYAEFLSEKLKTSDEFREQKYYLISIKSCRWINNIDHVGSYTREMGGRLNVKEIVDGFPAGGVTEEELLHKHFSLQIEALNTIVHKILDSEANKMEESMYDLVRPIIEEDGDWESNMRKEVEACLAYYQTNLQILADHLVLNYYGEGVGKIWDHTLDAFTRLHCEANKRQKLWKYFTRLEEVLEMVKGLLETELIQHTPSSSLLASNLKYGEIKSLLWKCGLSITALKMQYYEGRSIGETKGSLGSISTRAYYHSADQILFVEILNARNLKSSDSNGLSDPYVQVSFVPSEQFPTIPKKVTKVIKATLYPLFEETFAIKVGRSHFESGGFILFTVFDHDYLRQDDFLGECYFSFGDVESSEIERKVQDFPQRFLSLSTPSETDIEVLQSFLDLRPWDKDLLLLMKREKEKLSILH